MIGIVLGSPEPAFRRSLGSELKRHSDLEVLGDTGAPERLRQLVAAHRPSLVVLEAAWAHACSGLLGRLLARPVPPRILLYADTLTKPEVLAAVKQGVHGCLPRDAQPATWRQAILAIHAGECWIPRVLMATALAELKHLLHAERPAPPGMAELTQRQREIVRWVAQGLSNKEIGRRLGISPTTVKTHLHNIFERCGVNGRQQLVLRALRETASGSAVVS
ncbi:response regulator transcription factor [Fulvimonas yonginensis]|uniref:Response regulator transcription factor n=1 Tax=Fulvimonas yonginensis TaxID=1495200 RepID=A0ABU8JC88_9GAMM